MQVLQGEGEAIMKLTGALDINTVDEVQGMLLAHLKQSATIVVDLSLITSCDAAGAQLLFALARSAALAGKPFAVAATSEALIQDCANLGIDLALSMSTWSSTGKTGELDLKKTGQAKKTQAAVVVGELCNA